MSTKPIRESALTPEARRERAKRMLADAVVELIEATIEQGSAANEWLDQKTSPLGREKHLRLVQQGKLPARKLGKRVLVRKADLDAYLEREGIARGPMSSEAEEVVAAVERLMGGKR